MRRTMLERASSTGSRARRDAGESGTDEVLGWGIATMKRATMAGDTSRRLEGRARVWSRVAINSGVSRHAEVPTECLCRTSPELRVPFLHGSGKWTLSTAMWSGATQSTEADAPVAPSASWMTTQRRVTMWRTRFTKTHSRKRSSWASRPGALRTLAPRPAFWPVVQRGPGSAWAWSSAASERTFRAVRVPLSKSAQGRAVRSGWPSHGLESARSGRRACARCRSGPAF